ncbi:MAG: hypothetical protein WAO02_04130 [Verrucomicrobiia bacterium]
MKLNQRAKEKTAKTAANVCIASCQKLAAGIAQTKNNLLAEFRETLRLPEQLFRQAMSEAEAVAWQTDYPQLVFPTLAMEKVQAVATWHSRQQSLRRVRA